MAGNFKPPPRAKTALDNRKLNLSAPVPNVQGKYASLIWGLFSNNPRITVYTNDPNDNAPPGYGKISANLSLPAFMMFLVMLRKVIDSPGETKDKVENKNYTYFSGKRSDLPVVVSELHVGKDAEGVVWISVTDTIKKERPRIKFKFHPDDFHALVHGDGRPYSKGEASALYAEGYANLLDKMMIHMASENYVEPPPRDGGGGGGGGGGNREGGGGNWNRGGGGGGQPPAEDKDDDLPF